MGVVRAMAERVAGEPASRASLRHPVSPDHRRLEAATGIFQMLADPTRLHLLWLLSHGEADVTALVESCGAARTAVSQHLAKLRFTGLVDTRREGRRVIYRLRGGHVARLVQEGLNQADHLVTGEPPHE
ncbi:helix-turn-helix transcriptional regulator [Nocardia farcinica]|nr:helix-turn-helix transcriptional regulator [Nocardia farcinica]